jgi:hypothetical protein
MEAQVVSLCARAGLPAGLATQALGLQRMLGARNSSIGERRLRLSV